MIAALLAVVLGAAQGAPAHGPLLQVTGRDAGGAESPVLETAVSRALVVTGATVVVGRESREQCGNRCVQVTVVQSARGTYDIEAKQGAHDARATLTLPESASSQEHAAAIAIHARLLITWNAEEEEAPKPPPVKPAPVAQRPVAPPAPPPAPVAESAPVPPPPPPAPVEAASSAPEVAAAQLQPEPPHVLPSAAAERIEPAPVAVSGTQNVAPAATPAENLALGVSGTVLAGPETELFTWGLVVSARARLIPRLDASLSLGLLDGARAHAPGHPRPGGGDGPPPDGPRFRQRPLPVALAFTTPLPFVSGLRAGLGMELVSLLIERRDVEEDLTVLSAGFLGRVEYHRPVGRISIFGAAQVAAHPFKDDAAPSPDVFVHYPDVTIGVSAGVEFGLL